MAMQRLAQEDPTFRVSTEPDTGQTLISGMGELHLEIIVDRMLREYNVQANVGRPQVAYRETIRKKAEAEGKYIKQTGGRGQYGHCEIESASDCPVPRMKTCTKCPPTIWMHWRKKLLAVPAASGNSTKNTAFCSSTKWLAARFRANLLRRSKRAFAKHWTTAFWRDFTMVDVAVVLVDGSYHDVDSNEMAFKIAGSMAFKEACAQSQAGACSSRS